jgi:hypothetical protein
MTQFVIDIEGRCPVKFLRLLFNLQLVYRLPATVSSILRGVSNSFDAGLKA